MDGLLDLEYKDIPSRGLYADVCKRYGYGFATAERGSLMGDRVQVANYRRKGEIVSQHLRNKDKQFAWLESNPG